MHVNSMLVLIEEHIILYDLPNRLENDSAGHTAWCNLAKYLATVQRQTV